MSKPFRVLPQLNAMNRHFWTGGERGELCLLRCRACRHWIHPPAPICPVCLSREVGAEATSGRARVATFTVNHQPWIPGFEPPYVIAIVELEEQSDLRLMTNIVGCPVGDVKIDMPVQVEFREQGDVFAPVFGPV